MKIHFDPPQLEDAQSAEILTQLVQEMASDVCGELRVRQHFSGDSTRLILISPGLNPLSREVPHRWLYQPLSEEAIRRQLAALFRQLPASVLPEASLSAAA